MLEFLKAFFDQFGVSFLMMIVLGFVIAFVTEVAVKETYDWIKGKIGEKPWLAVAKAVCIQAFVIIQVIVYTKLLVTALPFPGGLMLYPVWLCLEYLIQYAWSLLGFKKFLQWLQNKAAKKAEAKAIEEANKPVLTPIPGRKDLFRNEEGKIVDRKGELI